MTGRIKTYDAGTSSGSIESDSGQDVQFDATVVVAYDVSWLAAGQAVTFQQANSIGSRASYVSVETPRASAVETRREQPVILRYLGFDQQTNTRRYRFERVVPGDENLMFSVTADLNLFTKHRIGIQEGPALCRTLLTNGVASGGKRNIALTEPDITTFIANRVVPVKKSFRKRAAPAQVAVAAVASGE